MTPRLRAALLALVGTSCHSFLALEADGRCGNEVLEPEQGEDCDTHAAGRDTRCGAPSSEHACHYECTDGAACPAGWACGLDGECRARAGDLNEPESLALDGTAFALADVDADARPDLVSFGGDAIVVGYGDRDGRFGVQRTIPAPGPDSTPTFADFDGDGAMDFAAPFAAGVQLFRGSRERELLPLPVASSATAGEPSRQLAVVHGPAPTAGDLVLSLAQPADGPPSFSVLEHDTDAASPLAALFADQFEQVGRPLASGIAANRAGQIAVSVQGGSLVAVAHADCPPPPAPPAEPLPCSFLVDDTVRVSDAATPSERAAVFADVDADGFDDLLLTVRAGDTPAVAVAHGAVDGFEAQAEVDGGLAPVMQCPRCPPGPDFLAQMLAAGDLGGDPQCGDDFVMTTTVYLQQMDPGAGRCVPVQSFIGLRPWISAIIRDVNGDGNNDIVATRPGVIDIAIAVGDGTFNTASLQTEGVPQFITTGDFDGDLSVDVAVVEPPGRVSVLFRGDQGFPTERVVMADVPSVQSIAALRSDAGAFGGVDGIDDLVVTQPAGDTELVVRLTGTTARRMLAPLPRPVPVLHVAVAGRFTGGAHADLVEIQPKARGPDDPPPTPGTPPPIALYLLQDVDTLDEVPPELAMFDAVVGCEIALDDYRADAADVDGDGTDELVLVASQFRGTSESDRVAWPMRIVDFTADGPVCHEAPAAEYATPPNAVVHADLDGDGHLDVAAVLDPGGPFPRDAQLTLNGGLAVWWGDGAGGFDAPSVFDTGPAAHVYAAPARIDAADRDELAVVNGQALEVYAFAHRAAKGRSLGPAPGGATSIAVGDADGDGLDDVLVGTDGAVLLSRQRPCGAAAAAHGQCERSAP